MSRRTIRHAVHAIITASLLAVLLCILSILFFRNLDKIFTAIGPSLDLFTYEVRQYAEIFEALRHARIHPPILITELLCVLTISPLIFFLLLKRKKRLIYVLLPVIVLLSAALLAITIYYSNVNDIRFDCVISALLTMINAGTL